MISIPSKPSLPPFRIYPERYLLLFIVSFKENKVLAASKFMKMTSEHCFNINTFPGIRVMVGIAGSSPTLRKEEAYRWEGK